MVKKQKQEQEKINQARRQKNKEERNITRQKENEEKRIQKELKDLQTIYNNYHDCKKYIEEINADKGLLALMKEKGFNLNSTTTGGKRSKTRKNKRN
jgi:hypothetical protein